MMSSAPARSISEHLRPFRTAEHSIAEFAQGVQLMSEEKVQSGERKPEIGELVEALTKQLADQVRTRPHPLIYANLAFIVVTIFWCGVLFQRVNSIEDRMRSAASVDAISPVLNDLREQQNQMRRDIEGMRERLDRALDQRH